MKLGGNLPLGHNALLFPISGTGIFYMPSRTDMAGHALTFLSLSICVSKRLLIDNYPKSREKTCTEVKLCPSLFNRNSFTYSQLITLEISRVGIKIDLETTSLGRFKRCPTLGQPCLPESTPQLLKATAHWNSFPSLFTTNLCQSCEENQMPKSVLPSDTTSAT